MKILYLTKGDHVDYQDDCLFIGLRELYGADVIDYNKRQHNYTSYDETAAAKLYGMGMSVTRILPDIEIDRTDLTSKIKNKYFDYVVYGSIHRCHSHIDNILKYYSKDKIIAVDGEDETSLHSVFDLGIPYFKRELIKTHPRLFPISFAIPTSKVNFCKDKTRDLAICDPRDRSTYIYKNEKDYYQGYKESRFAYTTKKAGWDCMRHYEILANGCIPIFLNVENCPNLTMTNFPKDLCKDVFEELKVASAEIVYNMLFEEFEEHFIAYNTTKAVASQFIQTITEIS